MPTTWEEVAEIVKQRRLSMGLSQRRASIAADVSPTTWASLERHHQPINDFTKAGMAKALRWPSDWCERLRAGEVPDESWSQPEPVDPVDALRAEVEELKAALQEIVARLPAGD